MKKKDTIMHDGVVIKIKRTTRLRLGEIGSKYETYDDIINRLLDNLSS